MECDSTKSVSEDSSSSECDPSEIIKQSIPTVKDNDYHDSSTRNLPVLAQPLQGLSVSQLCRFCLRDLTSVTYSCVFAVDLSCFQCIDDLRTDDNGVWIHGGKPRKKYSVEHGPGISEIISMPPFP